MFLALFQNLLGFAGLIIVNISVLVLCKMQKSTY